VIALIVSGPVPGFDSTTVCAAEFAPTVVVANVSVAGVKTACGIGGATPVPVNAAVCGEPAALSAMVTVAERLEAAVGVNVTVTAQEEPAASVDPQVPPVEKEPAFAPVRLMLEIFRVALPVLETVMLCEALVVPTVVPANVSDGGARLTTGAGAGMPVPATEIVCGEPAALSAMLTDAM